MTPRIEDDHSETSSAIRFLLELLSTEIARDGGAALVTSLKDYTAASTSTRGSLAPKRLNALLVESIQKPKVLAFLEAHPEIFQVDRRATPHWVVLKSEDYVDWPCLITEKQNAASQQAKLYDKILYALRHRYAKTERRRRRHQQDELADDSTAKNKHTDNTCNQQDGGVNMVWLLRQCSWDFHEYLRAAGIYLDRIYPNNRISYNNTHFGDDVPPHQDAPVNLPMKQIVQPAGTRPWEDLVLEEFISMLLEMTTEGMDCLIVNAAQKKVWFQNNTEESFTQSQATMSSTTASESLGTSNTDTLSYLQALDETLTELVDQDGATQVRLEILLHRHDKLKRLLGGRDLWDLVQQSRNNSSSVAVEGNYFDKINISKEGPDIILQSKNKSRGGRMKVDSEGHFSVANGKWGVAMAKTMVRCCRKVGWVTSTKFNSGSESAGEIPAIDLTASVGGMTLGLAKTRFFSQVIGIEIDAHRADLCRQNMAEHMSGEGHGIVDIRTMDAMDAIPTLPSQSCLVIDPPWGGENYKKKTQHEMKYPNADSTSHGCDQPSNFSSSTQQLRMGPWTLEDILCKIYHCLRPCLVGLRLPVTFVVDDLLERLRLRIDEAKVDDHDRAKLAFVQTLAVRKLSVQLFVVLYFSTDEA